MQMKEEYKLLHREMIHDIVRCMQLELPEEERVESCFWIANNYWEKLKEIIKDKTSPSGSLSEGEGGFCFFESETDEIEFFRNVKPHFTCHIEYYAILSEALQFVPKPSTSSDQEVVDFWKEESKRFERFCRKNHEFVNYHQEEKHECDSSFFLRKNNLYKTGQGIAIYDSDPEMHTSHDHVLRSYLAQKKYSEYVRGKIEELVRSQ